MSLDIQDLVKAMLTAIEPVLTEHWKIAKDYAEIEADKMAKTLANITELRVAKKIDDEQAKALLDMQKHAMQAVLLAIAGIGLIMAQKAINAALSAVKDAVNKAIGLPLL